MPLNRVRIGYRLLVYSCDLFSGKGETLADIQSVTNERPPETRCWDKINGNLWLDNEVVW
jgi:hypothetical protein